MGSRGSAGGGGGGTVQTEIGELVFAENGDFLGVVDGEDSIAVGELEAEMEDMFNIELANVEADGLEADFMDEVTDGVGSANFLQGFISGGRQRFGEEVIRENRLDAALTETIRGELRDILPTNISDRINASNWRPATRMPSSLFSNGNIEQRLEERIGGLTDTSLAAEFVYNGRWIRDFLDLP